MKQFRMTLEKIAPIDHLFVAAFGFLVNQIVYLGARAIAGGWEHHDFTSVLDARIPFLPETLLIYFGCYLFWILNYVLVSRLDDSSAYQFYFADVISRMVCFAFFLLLPTTNVRPEIVGHGFWEEGMRFLYRMDAADNLFPSIHCLVSWFCYIGVRGKNEIPKWYQWLSAVFACMVFVSTLTTKQHILIDVIGGVVIAEVCFWVSKHTTWYITYMKFWKRVLYSITKGVINEQSEKECI